MKRTISSRGQVTVPKSIRARYELVPGTEVEFEFRKDGVLLRKKMRGPRYPRRNAIGSLKSSWRWPKGVPHTVDAYIDYVRGGSYKDLTRREPRRSRRK